MFSNEETRLQRLYEILDNTIPKLEAADAIQILLRQIEAEERKQATKIQNHALPPERNKSQAMLTLVNMGVDPETAASLINQYTHKSPYSNSQHYGIPYTQPPSYPQPPITIPAQASSPVAQEFRETPKNDARHEAGWGIVIGIIVGLSLMTLFNIGNFLGKTSNFVVPFLPQPAETKKPVPRKTSNLKPAPKRGDMIGPFRVSSGFGWRNNPVTGQWQYHAAIDVAAPMGKPYFMPGSSGTQGKVTCGETPLGGFTATITSNDPRYANSSIILCHLYRNSCIAGVHSAGAIIGKVGNTGRSTGPHLHLVLRKNGRDIPQSERDIPPSRTILEEVLVPNTNIS